MPKTDPRERGEGPSTAGMKTSKLKPYPVWRIQLAFFMDKLTRFNFNEAFGVWRFEEWLASQRVNERRIDLDDLQALLREKGSNYARAFARGMAMLGIVAVIFLILSFLYYITYVGEPRVVNPGPTTQPIPPTMSIPTQVVPFKDYETLPQAEAIDLRGQPNVINVALLGEGYGARYMRDYGVILDASWEQVGQSLDYTRVNPPTTNSSWFLLEVNRVQYNLNVRQGFIVLPENGTAPTYIYVMDQDGTMWRTRLSSEPLVELQQAIDALPFEIAPNKDLALTLR